MGPNMDFELVLPFALGRFVPAALLGFLIAGLLAAFMSNFASTVNAAPPYFVNDIYKRFINPNAQPKTYVRLSYLASFAVVVIGVLIGWNVTSVNSVVLWDRLRIVGRLYRVQCFEVVLVALQRIRLLLGHGYRHRIRAGAGASGPVGQCARRATLRGQIPVNLDVTIVFPLVLGISLTGCLIGTLLTKPEDDAILMDFYRRVRPWASGDRF